MKTLSHVALLLTLAAAATASTPKASPSTVPGSVSLTTTLSNTHILLPGDGAIELAIDLQANDKANRNRLPMNIALVIDRSGSMRGSKMDNTLQAAMHLVRQLKRTDTLAIVSYSDDVRVDLPARRISQKSKADALAAIERIRAGGSTNLSGGLIRGQSEVRRNLKTGQINRVILMSDGLANRGITNTKQLAQHVQKESQNGISVTTMGVGTDYNEDLMTAVADHASGNYYFIESAKQISSVFASELKKIFATVAQSTQVTIQLEDGVDLKQVHGYTFQRKSDKILIPLAEMFANQKRSILVELKVPTIREGKTKVATVSLTYSSVSQRNTSQTARVDLDIEVTRDKELVDAGQNKSVLERIEEVRVAKVITQAADLLKQGRGEEARKLLRTQRAKTNRQVNAVGGSKRLSRQVRQLDNLHVQFEEAEAAPAKAAGMVKKAKASARSQAR